ncbi:MAG: DnaA/Hda family protein [bacterium]|nr:DnaA/Hda family protein [bacterium]
MAESFIGTLLELGIITREQLDEAISRQWKEGGDTEENLVRLGYFTEESLITLLSRKFHYHILDLNELKMSPEAMKLVPSWIAKRFFIIPVRQSDTSLAVVMTNPLDREAMSNLRKSVYLDVFPFVAKKSDIESALTKYYGPSLPEEEMHKATLISKMAPPIPSLLKKYTFENFVTGKCNDFAYSVALSVARTYSDDSNPFFIYSDIGLGKTHLLVSIWNYMIERQQSRKVLFYSSDRFVEELRAAIESKRMDEFKDQYKAIDILLIDDIGLIAGDEVAQQQFFHIFNELFQNSKQIVVTSDRPPKELSTLSQRLRSRFEGGLIAEIEAPDLETRVAILKFKAKGAKVPNEILSLIAERVTTNVRELEGVLKEVIAFSRYEKEPITKEVVEKILQRRLVLKPYTE